jgi:hypothetical protein
MRRVTRFLLEACREGLESINVGITSKPLLEMAGASLLLSKSRRFQHECGLCGRKAVRPDSKPYPVVDLQPMGLGISAFLSFDDEN